MKLKQLISEKSKQQKDVAEAVGIDPSLMSRIVNLKVLPTADVLDKMCEVLNASVDEIYDEGEYEKAALCATTERQCAIDGDTYLLHTQDNTILPFSQEEYVKKLRAMSDTLGSLVEKNVFDYVLRAYERTLTESTETKFVSKMELNLYLRAIGLINSTDSREVRRAARELLKKGFPVAATSRTKGYFIVDDWTEYRAAKAENKSRIRNLFQADKGFRRIAQLMGGQIDVFEGERR